MATKTNPGKDVAVSSNAGSVVDDKPAYLQKFEQEGNVRNEDNFDQSDIVVPRIKLLQATSAEVEQFEGARVGLFWHTGFDAALGEEVRFVVCSRKKKYLLVTPLTDGAGVLARAEDAETWDRTGSWEVKLKNVKKPVTWEINDLNVEKSGMTKWGTSNPEDEDSPPAATLFYEYLVLLPDYPEYGPAVISLARSQVRKAKKGLNDKISLHRASNRPMQSLVFKATTANEQNAEGQAYKNWAFQGAGFADEKLFGQAMELRDMLSSYRVEDEADVLHDEEKNAEGDDTPVETERY